MEHFFFMNYYVTTLMKRGTLVKSNYTMLERWFYIIHERIAFFIRLLAHTFYQIFFHKILSARGYIFIFYKPFPRVIFVMHLIFINGLKQWVYVEEDGWDKTQ